MYLNSVTVVGFLGADPKERWHEIHGALGRDTAILEECAGRMVLEDRVAPRLHLSPAPC
jgi:hypothetical protein